MQAHHHAEAIPPDDALEDKSPLVRPAPTLAKRHSSRIEELDGLRGIAVLAVVAHHYLSWLPVTGSSYGWLGVDLFFNLSGFLITTILLDLRGKEHFFKVFYARRALRIFPAYFLGIFVFLGVSLALGRPGTVGLWSQYIFYYTSLFVGFPAQLQTVPEFVALGLAVLWSLSVEEIYYTVWAPVIRFTTQKRLIWILTGMIIAPPLLRWWLHTPKYPELFTFYCRMDGLAYGSAVALLIHQWRLSQINWLQIDKIIAGLTVTILPLTALFWMVTHGDRSRTIVSTVGVVLADLSFALIVYALIRRSGSSQFYIKLFRARWLRSIGMVSYSLYLFHYPLLAMATKLASSLHYSRRITAILQVLIGLTLSCSIAYGLWYGLESRILRWKDRHVPTPASPS